MAKKYIDLEAIVKDIAEGKIEVTGDPYAQQCVEAYRDVILKRLAAEPAITVPAAALTEEDMAFQIKRTNTYIEHDIVVGGAVIGSAEIEPQEKELSRLAIFAPYQNRGYGTRAVKELISRYGVHTLWVRSDNQRAIHVYEKCGFRKSGETMFEMELKEE